ncbi:MATE family efflux transporter [Treponema pectinovorum]|uniref:MATE family efflux transporter n=1 Tax=Treponema pectinovorum TaxID=164 RepID=UPI003D93C58F
MFKTFDLSRLLTDNASIPLKQRIKFVLNLSIPGMMAQLSSILMQYIDASMVGTLGANQSASIGLVASSTWVMGSLLHAIAVGFTVQVAHAIGAGKREDARNILFNAILCCTSFSIFIAIVAGSLSFKIPLWLGASTEIYNDALWYFFVFALSSPFYEIVYLLSGVQQGSGNMKLPGILNALMCFLDIIFNYLFIFILDMGVKGAAFGSACSALSVALIFCYLTLVKSETLKFIGQKDFFVDKAVLKKAIKLALPVGLESSAFSGALVVITRIIAPLGAVSLAANSFAVTAESLCYMPGYGVQEATTTLVGQSYGAKRKDLVCSFSWITVAYGMGIMALIAWIMYFACPYVFAFITPDIEIQELSVKILRIALFAEPLFGASIVCTGALRGRADTLIPSLMNLFSLWVVRLGLSFVLVKPYGLVGIWIAMASELCFRGLIMLCRLAFAKIKF